MDYTPNLNLKKPTRTDQILIGDLNDNMDVLDQEVQNLRGIIDQEVQDIQGIIDQKVQDIQGIIDQKVQDIQGIIDQEVQDIQGIIDQKVQDIQDIIDQEIQGVWDTIDQEIQSIIDQKIQGIWDTIDQEIQSIIDQEIQDLRDIIDQEIQDIWDVLNNLDPVYHTVLTATLDTDGWTGTEAPFVQIQEVSGILATDVPIVDVVLSGDWEVDEARLEAWGYVYRIVTSDDSITVYAREKPDVALPLQLKVVG